MSAMSAQIGGGYNALVSSKRAKKGKDGAQGSSQPTARREAKVLTLKEGGGVKGKKDSPPPVVKPAPKKPAPKKSGVSPARLAKEAEDARKRREKESRQMTYDDHVKQQKEKAKDLPQAPQARRVDGKAFAKFAEMQRDGDDDSIFSGFGKKKDVTPPPTPAGKKSKPKKIELSFSVGNQGAKIQKLRGPPTWNDESKVDVDGEVRTKREFYTLYNGFAEWDKAPAASGAALVAASVAPAAPAVLDALTPETWRQTWPALADDSLFGPASDLAAA